jgi:hypothetical protein
MVFCWQVDRVTLPCKSVYQPVLCISVLFCNLTNKRIMIEKTTAYDDSLMIDPDNPSAAWNNMK